MHSSLTERVKSLTNDVSSIQSALKFEKRSTVAPLTTVDDLATCINSLESHVNAIEQRLFPAVFSVTPTKLTNWMRGKSYSLLLTIAQGRLH
jgi:hypothetical protein